MTSDIVYVLSATNEIQIYVCIQMWSMLLYLGLQENCKARAHFSSGSKNIRSFGVRMNKKNTNKRFVVFNIFWHGRYSEC